MTVKNSKASTSSSVLVYRLTCQDGTKKDFATDDELMAYIMDGHPIKKVVTVKAKPYQGLRREAAEITKAKDELVRKTGLAIENSLSDAAEILKASGVGAAAILKKVDAKKKPLKLSKSAIDVLNTLKRPSPTWMNGKPKAVKQSPAKK